MVLQLSVVGMAKARVLIKGNFAVERQNLSIVGFHQWVDLHERGIFLYVDFVQLLKDRHELRDIRLIEPGLVRHVARECVRHAVERREAPADKRMRTLLRELFDFHSAFFGQHGQVPALRAVEHNREVILLSDVSALGNHHLADNMPLDIEAQNLIRNGCCFFWTTRDLHAARFTASADLHLGLDDNELAARLHELCRGTLHFQRRGRHDAAQHGDSMRFEEVTSLVLVEIHNSSVHKFLEVCHASPILNFASIFCREIGKEVNLSRLPVLSTAHSTTPMPARFDRLTSYGTGHKSHVGTRL